MTRNNWLLVAFAAVLAGVYIFYFTDWFRPKTVEIFHAYRNLNPRPGRGGALPALKFGINRQLRITEIKVVPADAWQTNQNILPVWHLVSDSNSVPVKSFFYGQFIGGMRPAVKGTLPLHLGTNVLYRLFVTAGKIKGQHDFELK